MAQANLTEKQVAERLRVSVRTVQAWRHKRRGPRYFKLSPGRGGRVRYRESDIAVYESERLTDAGGAAA